MLFSLGRAEALEATVVVHIRQDAMEDHLKHHLQVYTTLQVTRILTLGHTNQTYCQLLIPAIIEGTKVFDIVLICK